MHGASIVYRWEDVRRHEVKIKFLITIMVGMFNTIIKPCLNEELFL
jgi:hypothetical protein